MPKDPEDTNMPSGDREPILKAVGHKPRMRKICHQAKKGGKKTNEASITFAFNTLYPLSWLH